MNRINKTTEIVLEMMSMMTLVSRERMTKMVIMKVISLRTLKRETLQIKIACKDRPKKTNLKTSRLMKKMRMARKMLSLLT